MEDETKVEDQIGDFLLYFYSVYLVCLRYVFFLYKIWVNLQVLIVNFEQTDRLLFFIAGYFESSRLQWTPKAVRHSDIHLLLLVPYMHE